MQAVTWPHQEAGISVKNYRRWCMGVFVFDAFHPGRAVTLE